VYKLSGESANKENDRRAQLLAEHPELADLVNRIQKNAADNDARSQLVAVYFDQQLYWAAYELLTAAAAKNEVDSETNLNLARIWDVWGQYDLALKYVERAIAGGDSSTRAFEVIGRIHLHRNEPAAAISWYTRAAQLSDDATILANLGYSYILVSDWEKAKTILENAIALDGTLPEAHNNLAVVLMNLGDDKAALSELQKAAPAHVALNNMGVLYLQKEKLARARELFEEALQLAPKYDVAQRNLTAVQALLPPALVPETSLDNPPQNASVNVNGNCPAADNKPGPTLVQTQQLSTTPVNVDFMGSSGMVDTDLMPLDQQSGSQPTLADAAVPARLNIKKTRAIEWIEQGASEKVIGQAENIVQADGQIPSGLAIVKAGELKRTERTPAVNLKPTALESNGMACMHSSTAHHDTSRSMFQVDGQWFGMCGIMGVLFTTAALAIRRNKPAVVAKVTIRPLVPKTTVEVFGAGVTAVLSKPRRSSPPTLAPLDLDLPADLTDNNWGD
jgi:tetratricopeptide (TPR) repeat protein